MPRPKRVASKPVRLRSTSPGPMRRHQGDGGAAAGVGGISGGDKPCVPRRREGGVGAEGAPSVREPRGRKKSERRGSAVQTKPQSSARMRRPAAPALSAPVAGAGRRESLATRGSRRDNFSQHRGGIAINPPVLAARERVREFGCPAPHQLYFPPSPFLPNSARGPAWGAQTLGCPLSVRRALYLPTSGVEEAGSSTRAFFAQNRANVRGESNQDFGVQGFWDARDPSGLRWEEAFGSAGRSLSRIQRHRLSPPYYRQSLDTSSSTLGERGDWNVGYGLRSEQASGIIFDYFHGGSDAGAPSGASEPVRGDEWGLGAAGEVYEYHAAAQGRPVCSSSFGSYSVPLLDSGVLRNVTHDVSEAHDYVSPVLQSQHSVPPGMGVPLTEPTAAAGGASTSVADHSVGEEVARTEERPAVGQHWIDHHAGIRGLAERGLAQSTLRVYRAA
ncbi:uncharacterized protein LOC142143181 [Mixophyes fleayi]|uniref:uncharacterized protein LOC142143181 n=1 Tax=Mixophyes fleayi TaxID=3061075 RepID=UPI003F4D747E